MPENELMIVRNEEKENIRRALDLDEEKVTSAVTALKSWLDQQPHLPHDEEDGRLEMLLIRCKNSLEKTKQTLDLYYTLRTYNPDIMCGWDATEPWFDASVKYGCIFPLPRLTPELDRVTLLTYFDRPLDDDYDVLSSVKLMLMMMEVRITEDYNISDVYVMDMKNLRIDHVKYLTLPVIKKIDNCFLKGYKSRLKAVHFINAPSYATVVINIFKSVLNTKLVSRVFVYGNDLTEFHKQVPKYLLPKELGGESASVVSHWELWKHKMKECSDWFYKREQMKCDESKRIQGSGKTSYLFGADGSFRKLTID